MNIILATIGLSLLAAEKTEVPIADVPPAVLEAVQTARPGFTPEEAETESRNGVAYYDIEGTDAAGEAWEFDVMAEGDGWKVVEIQRDISMDLVPAAVRDALEKASPGFSVARIIESTQTDGRIVFEFFDNDKAKREVLWDGKMAEFLTEEWEH